VATCLKIATASLVITKTILSIKNRHHLAFPAKNLHPRLTFPRPYNPPAFFQNFMFFSFQPTQTLIFDKKGA